MNTNTHVSICEFGPRDGLQMAAQMMPTDVKLRWIAQLAAAGLKGKWKSAASPPRG